MHKSNTLILPLKFFAAFVFIFIALIPIGFIGFLKLSTKDVEILVQYGSLVGGLGSVFISLVTFIILLLITLKTQHDNMELQVEFFKESARAQREIHKNGIRYEVLSKLNEIISKSEKLIILLKVESYAHLRSSIPALLDDLGAIRSSNDIIMSDFFNSENVNELYNTIYARLNDIYEHGIDASSGFQNGSVMKSLDELEYCVPFLKFAIKEAIYSYYQI